MSVAQTIAPPTAELLVARARAMMPHIAASAAEARQARRVSESVIAQIEEAGLFRILQPARWGGYEMKPETYYDVLIALAEGDMSVGWVYGVLGVHPWLMGLMDERAVQDVWGDDDSVRLCSSLMPVGKAEKVDGGFKLSGHWRFSSGCHYAQWALLGGAVQGGAAGAAPDIRLFMVPQAEYRIADAWRVSGLCATGSDDILVDEVFVPEYRTRRMIDNFQCVGAGLATQLLAALPDSLRPGFLPRRVEPVDRSAASHARCVRRLRGEAERAGRQVGRRSGCPADLRRGHGGHR